MKELNFDDVFFPDSDETTLYLDEKEIVEINIEEELEELPDYMGE